MIHYMLRSLGYKVVKTADEIYQKITDETFNKIHAICAPYTLTSIERMYGLYKATAYVAQHNIPGAILSCWPDFD